MCIRTASFPSQSHRVRCRRFPSVAQQRPHTLRTPPTCTGRCMFSPRHQAHILPDRRHTLPLEFTGCALTLIAAGVPRCPNTAIRALTGLGATIATGAFLGCTWPASTLTAFAEFGPSHASLQVRIWTEQLARIGVRLRNPHTLQIRALHSTTRNNLCRGRRTPQFPQGSTCSSPGPVTARGPTWLQSVSQVHMRCRFDPRTHSCSHSLRLDSRYTLADIIARPSPTAFTGTRRACIPQFRRPRSLLCPVDTRHPLGAVAPCAPGPAFTFTSSEPAGTTDLLVGD